MKNFMSNQAAMRNMRKEIEREGEEGRERSTENRKAMHKKCNGFSGISISSAFTRRNEIL